MSDKVLNTNKTKNLPLREIKLSIGQCKIIYAMLWRELSNFEDDTTIFEKNALETLYERFEQYIKNDEETDSERKKRLSNWSGKLQIVHENHG